MDEGFSIARLERADAEKAKELIREYFRWIGLDLSFQHVEEELETFPGKYKEPQGAFLCAKEGQELIGCVGLRRIDDETCELKRLFVKEGRRDRGLGKALVLGILEEARQRGYARIRLDTLSSMEAAVKLYREAGFREIGQYVENPLEGALFMEKRLDEDAGRGSTSEGREAWDSSSGGKTTQ